MQRESQRYTMFVPPLTRMQKHTLAGRFLRRLPLLAYSGYLLPQSGGADEESLERSLADWVAAMAQATDAEIESRRKMGLKSD